MTSVQYLIHLAFIVIVVATTVLSLAISRAPIYKLKAPIFVWTWSVIAIIGSTLWLSNLVMWLLNGAPNFGILSPTFLGTCAFLLLEIPSLLIVVGYLLVRLYGRLKKK